MYDYFGDSFWVCSVSWILSHIHPLAIMSSFLTWFPKESILSILYVTLQFVLLLHWITLFELLSTSHKCINYFVG